MLGLYLFPSWPQNCHFYSQEVPASENLLCCSVRPLRRAVRLPPVPAVPLVIWPLLWRIMCCGSPRPRPVSGWRVAQIPGDQKHMHCWHFGNILANHKMLKIPEFDFLICKAWKPMKIAIYGCEKRNKLTTSIESFMLKLLRLIQSHDLDYSFQAIH